MHRASRVLAGILSLAGAASVCAVQGQGLSADQPPASWANWQGRALVGSSVGAWQAHLGAGERMGLKVNSIGLVGDYFFGRSLVDQRGNLGFRTTGGVLYGPRSQLTSGRLLLGKSAASLTVDRTRVNGADGAAAESASEITTLPYLGIGYTGLSLKGAWRFNADVGMLAVNPGNGIKLGKVVGGTQTLDDLLREMRLAPVLQLGVSYSF